LLTAPSVFHFATLLIASVHPIRRSVLSVACICYRGISLELFSYIRNHFTGIFVYGMFCRSPLPLSLTRFAYGIDLMLNLIYEVTLAVLICFFLRQMQLDSAALFDSFSYSLPILLIFWCKVSVILISNCVYCTSFTQEVSRICALQSRGLWFLCQAGLFMFNAWVLIFQFCELFSPNFVFYSLRFSTCVCTKMFL
jgi:hypothetical protein